MRFKFFDMLIFLLLLFLSACGGNVPPTPEEIGNVERGREIFETGAGITREVCIWCHSLDGTIQNKSHLAPSLLGISELAGDRVSGLSAVEYLKESIVEPAAYVVEGYEPTMDIAYKYLFSEEDLNDLIAFMLTQ